LTLEWYAISSPCEGITNAFGTLLVFSVSYGQHVPQWTWSLTESALRPLLFPKTWTRRLHACQLAQIFYLSVPAAWLLVSSQWADTCCSVIQSSPTTLSVKGLNTNCLYQIITAGLVHILWHLF